MMIPIPRAGIYQSVSGVDDARAVSGVADIAITARPGQQLVPLPEGAGYPGFIFAEGTNPANVEESLRRAHARLNFEISPVLDVIRS
jgi:hypothetical protein